MLYYLKLMIFLGMDYQKKLNVLKVFIEKQMNCLQFLQNYDKYQDTALLLSWVDYEELGISILELYKGIIVISVGNYFHNSPNYLKKLNDEYHNLKTFNLKMPWGLEEKIEIYKRKI